MKKQYFQLLLCVFVANIASFSAAFAQITEYKLIPYRKGELWGYSDVSKKMLIAPEYEEVNFFVGNHAIVRKIMDIGGKKTGAYGVIDPQNKVIVPIKYYDIRFRKDTKGQPVFECVPLALKEVYDYYDAAGKPLNSPELEQLLAKKKDITQKSDVEPILNGEKFGLLRNGKDTVVSAIYDLMNPTVNGYFLAASNGKFGIISSKGVIVVPFEYMRANPLGAGFSVVKDRTLKEGFVSPNYNYTLPCKYFKILQDYGSFVEVRLEGTKNKCIVGQDGMEYCEE